MRSWETSESPATNPSKAKVPVLEGWQWNMKRYASNEIEAFVSEPVFDGKEDRERDESWPKITIVTPSFNQARFLERTIMSVLNQQYPNLEYIILDGGSTDGSVEILEKYDDALAYWVSEEDGGQADAIGKGFRLATGQILAFLNSDDIYLPGTLRRVGRTFREDSSLDFVYGNMCLIDEDGRIIGDRRLTSFIPYLSKLGLLYGGFGIYQPAAFWTKASYDAIGGVDASFQFAMDTDLILRLALAGAKFRFLREFFTAFRIHGASKTSTIRHIAREEGKAMRRRHRKHDNRLLALACLTLLRLTRTMLHLVQGDGLYLLKRKLQADLAWVP